jgi:recombination protein RecA
LLDLPFTYVEVKEISKSSAKVYDLCVPGPANFVGNGFVNHNTTVCLQIVAEAQKAGGTALFVDAEHALDLKLAKGIGVDVESLLVNQPDCGEDALNMVEMFVQSAAADIIVVDSVAALVPRAEISGEMGDPSMGVQARMMSQAMRKLTAVVAKTKTIVIFVNQIRMKIGVMFGNPETTSGGNALKFYSSVRLDTRRVQTIKEGDVPIGVHTKIKVVKNKVAAPFRETQVDIIFGKGVSREGDLVDLAVRHDVIIKSGSFFSFGEQKLGQGRDKVIELLQKDPVLFSSVYDIVVDKAKNAPIV